MGSPKVTLQSAPVLKCVRHLENSLNVVQHSKKQQGIVTEPDALAAGLTVGSYVISTWRSGGWISTASIPLYPKPYNYHH